MKYVKTFESFNYESTNEGWLWGEGNIWNTNIYKIIK